MKELCKHDTLFGRETQMDKQKIKELLLKYRKNKNKKIRDELIEEARPLVYIVSRKFVSLGENYNDIKQVGLVGLLKAIDDYEDQGGDEHISYIFKKILGEIRHYFRDNFKMIRVPRRYYKINKDINNFIQSYAQINKGKSPTIKEISQGLELSEELILEATEVISNCSMVNIDRNISGGSTVAIKESFMENKNRHKNNVDFEENIDNMVFLREIMADLSFRDKKILQLYMIENITQKDLAKRFKLSQVGIHRVINKALNQCRLTAERQTKKRKQII